MQKGAFPHRGSCRWLRTLLIFTIFYIFVSLTYAHDPGLSIVTAHCNPDVLEVHLAMSPPDVQYLAPVDTNHDGKISSEELSVALPQLQKIALGAFDVKEDARTIPTAKARIQVDNTGAIIFNIFYPGLTGDNLSIRSLILSNLPRFHRQYISVRNNENKLMGEAMLDDTNDSFSLVLAKKLSPPPLLTSFIEFLKLGITHIATGYDHILFLMGLLMVGGSFKSALKIITSFTIAHSITLVLATLNLINIPSRVIESLIALSIIYVGVENVIVRNMDKRWLLAFGFGLVHGCGFASSLRALGIGSNGTETALPLFSFNLGVEIAQMTVAALVLPIIWNLSESPQFVRRFIPVGSSLIALAGSWWLLQRTVL